jgi:hypothetical protein
MQLETFLDNRTLIQKKIKKIKNHHLQWHRVTGCSPTYAVLVRDRGKEDATVLNSI